MITAASSSPATSSDRLRLALGLLSSNLRRRRHVLDQVQIPDAGAEADQVELIVTPFDTENFLFAPNVEAVWKRTRCALQNCSVLVRLGWRLS